MARVVCYVNERQRQQPAIEYLKIRPKRQRYGKFKNLLLAVAIVLTAFGIMATYAFAQNAPTEFPPGSFEDPEEPTDIKPAPWIVCANGQHPTCHPVNDLLCWNWCDVAEYSLADVYHYDGGKWKNHWKACEANLDQWVAHSEALQKQIGKCKKFKGINLPRSK